MRYRTLIAALIGCGSLVACATTPPEPTHPVSPAMSSPKASDTQPVASASATPAKPAEEPMDLTPAADLAQRLAKFAPVVMDVDDKAIPAEQKALLRKLVEASQLMQQLYMTQLDPRLPEMRAKLAADPSKEKALAYFDIMGGPWDGLKDDEPFIGTKHRPDGASYYPSDMTKTEFEGFLAKNPDKKEAFQDYFTVIRRTNGTLSAVPYSEAYQPLIKAASDKLREAAALAKEPTLKKFLEMRADAFLSNHYRESDKAWMEVQGPIEATIGPYETYTDKLMGLKASFEAFISLRDEAESKKLEQVSKLVPQMDANLPLDAKLRASTTRGSNGSVISVVQVLCNSGQGGVQTVAYNLPNDDFVRNEKGSKKVMLKNIFQGKFDRIVKPITQTVLAEDQQKFLNFESMFSYILMHEMAHGMGPGIINLPDGSKTEIGKTLKELYGGIEEAKADIAGLVSAQYLIDHKVFPAKYEKEIYVAYLATVFRQVRFGAEEAHSRGAVASFNYLVKKGGIRYNAKTGRFGIDFTKIKGAVRDLAGEYLTIEAKGDYEGAKKFLEQWGKPSDEMKKALAGIHTDIPVDIAPQFAVYQKMQSW